MPVRAACSGLESSLQTRPSLEEQRVASATFCDYLTTCMSEPIDAVNWEGPTRNNLQSRLIEHLQLILSQKRQVQQSGECINGHELDYGQDRRWRRHLDR
jgi:hypothetical protein